MPGRELPLAAGMLQTEVGDLGLNFKEAHGAQTDEMDKNIIDSM